MTLSRRSVLTSSAALAAAAAFGLRPESVLAAEGGALKLAISTDISSLDPAWFVSGGAESGVLFVTMPMLARPVQDANGTWGWEPSEFVEMIEQPDDLHINFRLKPGFMWSDDGGELTAEDVKFSFERYIGSDWATRWPTLDHVEVTDTYSGTIVLNAPFVALWTMTLAFDSGFILPKAMVEALPEAKIGTTLPAQLGPYRMTEWVPQQKVVLTKNPGWTATEVVFDTIEFVLVADGKAAEFAIEAGEIDAAEILSETAANWETAPIAGSTLSKLPGSYYQWIGMNVDHPKLQDIRVRKAIQMAIDVPTVVQAAYAGTSGVAGGIVPDGILGARPATSYNYDPEAAKALLAEAGVNGLELDLRYDVTTNSDAIVGQVVQANLADIGVNVTLMPVDSGVYWNLGLESEGDDWKDLQLTIIAYKTGPDPADALQWFHSSQVGVWNWERWSDPEWDKLWDAALSEKDPAKRGAMYLQMQDIMEDTGAYVFITYWPRLWAISDRLKPAFYPGGDLRAEAVTLA